MLASGGPRAATARLAMRPAVLAAMCCSALALSGAWAGDERDHERARSAVQAGEVLPLPALLETLRRTHPGQVLELDLERDDGRWIYEVKLLQANGQLLKLELDAGTGQVLQVKRKLDRMHDRKGESSKEASK
ncbi:MAG TPA: PepSY domain-containing protein [Rubrivivax sp.]|nr:PepSY domain-containing protein [Rubrivivax sp.]